MPEGVEPATDGNGEGAAEPHPGFEPGTPSDEGMRVR